MHTYDVTVLVIKFQPTVTSVLGLLGAVRVSLALAFSGLQFYLNQAVVLN